MKKKYNKAIYNLLIVLFYIFISFFAYVEKDFYCWLVKNGFEVAFLLLDIIIGILYYFLRDLQIAVA